MKRIVIKYKIAKRNLYRRILQSMADGIIDKLKKSKSDDDFTHWYALGHQVDIIAKFQNIYLK